MFSSFFELYYAGVMREKKSMRVGDKKMKVIWLLKVNNSIEDMKIIMRGLRGTPCITFWYILCEHVSQTRR